VDDLVFRRSARRLTALVYTWAIIGGGLAILNAASHLAVSSASITIWPIVGGALLGGGAVLNGSCTTGAVCRVGSGEYRFALAVVGFFLGCLVAPALFGSSATQSNRRPVASATLQHPWLSISAGLVALTLVVVRCVRSDDRWVEAIHRPWDPRVASAVIALLYVATYELVGRWSYTDLLGDLARGKATEVATRTALLLALFTGAVIGGRTQRGTQPIGPLSPHMLRCLTGGTVMGLGYSLTHSAFDGLTFVGQPLLLPLAWTTMAATYAAITLGMAVLRAPTGGRVASLRGTATMPVEMFSGR